MLAILAVAVIISFVAINRIQTAYDRFLDVNTKLVGGANELRFELRDQVAHYRAILLYPDQQKKYWDDLQADHHSFAKTLDNMRRLAPTAEGLDMLNTIASIQAKHEQLQERTVELAQQGKLKEALAMGVKEVLPFSDKLIDDIERFSERQLKLEAEGRVELDAAIRFTAI